MIRFFAVVAVLAVAPWARAQTCTNLCLQQVTCPSGVDTTVTGTVYMPNGTVPLPNVLVYVPNAPVQAFPAGVSCTQCSQPPSGSPLMSAVTDASGAFILHNVPVGTNIPLVIQVGRWRRQTTIANVAQCTNTTVPTVSTRMPATQAQGDIPRTAIITGAGDTEECLLRKIGVSDTEFTNPSGAGRINLFLGSTNGGAGIDASTPGESALTSNAAVLDSYDTVMMGCQNVSYVPTAQQIDNFNGYLAAGGRSVMFHYALSYLVNDSTYSGLTNWQVGQSFPPDQTGYIDDTTGKAATYAQFLQLTGASTTYGQFPVTGLRHDYNGVNAPAVNWLEAHDATRGTVPLQFSFNTPPTSEANVCGRVTFFDYHVNVGTSGAAIFPSECLASSLTSQEIAAAYSLFDAQNCVQADANNPSTAVAVGTDRRFAEPQSIVPPLQVQLTTAGGTHPGGIPVIFTAVPGAGGATGAFVQPIVDQVTNYDGIATAPFLLTGSVPGTFTVTTNVGVTFSVSVGDAVFANGFE